MTKGDVSAYPVLAKSEVNEEMGYTRYMSADGLTKREYFAAHALQGVLADPNLTTISHAAVLAVNAADALIERLNTTKPKHIQEKKENENED